MITDMRDELLVERYRTLLFEVSEAIATHRDLTALFRDLARRLPVVFRSSSSRCFCTMPTGM